MMPVPLLPFPLPPPQSHPALFPQTLETAHSSCTSPPAPPHPHRSLPRLPPSPHLPLLPPSLPPDSPPSFPPGTWAASPSLPTPQIQDPLAHCPRTGRQPPWP